MTSRRTWTSASVLLNIMFVLDETFLLLGLDAKENRSC